MNVEFRQGIKNLVTACRFKIGTKYTDRKGYECEIINVRLTFDASGDWTDTRYVVSHKLMGQDIIDYNVVDTTIARALWNDSLTAPTTERRD